MLYQRLDILLNALVQASSGILAWGVVAGLIIWLLGGILSRPMLSLAAVVAGSWIGVRLPSHFGWSIEPTCVGMFGAFIGATAVYLFHRSVVGIGLGLIAAAWAVAAVWIRFDGPTRWHPVDLHWTGSLTLYLAQVWRSFPSQLGVALPYACGAGLSSGIITGVLWPGLSRSLFHSLMGTTMLVAFGLPLVVRSHPGWLDLALQSIQQIFILFGFVGIGVTVQSCFSFKRRQPKIKGAPGGRANRPKQLVLQQSQSRRPRFAQGHPQTKPLAEPAAAVRTLSPAVGLANP